MFTNSFSFLLDIQLCYISFPSLRSSQSCMSEHGKTYTQAWPMRDVKSILHPQHRVRQSRRKDPGSESMWNRITFSLNLFLFELNINSTLLNYQHCGICLFKLLIFLQPISKLVISTLQLGHVSCYEVAFIFFKLSPAITYKADSMLSDKSIGL